jgi:HEAT repeat protein
MASRLQELLTRLKKQSPMPSDEEVTEEQVEEYEEVLNDLQGSLNRKKDVSAVRPLIDSFGYGDGNGVYWTTLHILEKFANNDLLPQLRDAIRSGSPGSRMWASLMLGRAQDHAAITDLLKLLMDAHEHIRANAVLSLSMLGDPSTRKAIEQLQQDPSEVVRDAVETALSDFPEGN